MLSNRECQNISVLPAKSHKNGELKYSQWRSARHLVADLDTIYYNRRRHSNLFKP